MPRERMPNHHIHLSPLHLNSTKPFLYLTTNMSGQSSLIRSLPVPAEPSPDIPHFQPSRWPRSFTIPCLHTSCALHLDHECSLIRTRRYYRRFGKRSSPRSRRAVQPNLRSMTYPSPTPHQSTRKRQQYGEETQKMERIHF